MSAPLIVTAELGPADLARLDELRRRHFPPERNQLAAHLTMFHAIPAMLEPELKQRLAAIAASSPPPTATLAGLMDLGGGVAFRITSYDLDIIREDLSDAFRGSLTQQDSHGWRPHITIQNKVEPREAKALQQQMRAGFEPRPLDIKGIATWHYLGGPWQPIRSFVFRG